MAQPRYLCVEELPPRPDPSTGLPRPPRAPGFIGADVPVENSVIRERDQALAPSPPPRQSPVLVWYRESRRGAVIAAVMIVLLAAGIASLTRGTAWIMHAKYWGVWAFLTVSLVVVYFFFRGGRYSAGADWVARGKKWVKVYDLVKVVSRSYPGGPGVYLRDSGGRTLRFKFVDLSSDRMLWDLTYNGILHSVIAGRAETNWMLRKSLALPYPQPDEGSDS
jgi:hypothetical protein